MTHSEAISSVTRGSLQFTRPSDTWALGTAWLRLGISQRTRVIHPLPIEYIAKNVMAAKRNVNELVFILFAF